MSLFIRTAIAVDAFEVTAAMIAGAEPLPPGYQLEGEAIALTGKFSLSIVESATPGDWIVREGESLFCVSPEYFNANYQRAELLGGPPVSDRLRDAFHGGRWVPAIAVTVPSATVEPIADSPTKAKEVHAALNEGRRPATSEDVLSEILQLQRERDNWLETARWYANGEEFYRGLLDQCAAHLGDAVFICDDGTRSISPLRLKIPPLVCALAAKAEGATTS